MIDHLLQSPHVTGQVVVACTKVVVDRVIPRNADLGFGLGKFAEVSTGRSFFSITERDDALADEGDVVSGEDLIQSGVESVAEKVVEACSELIDGELTLQVFIVVADGV